MSPRLTNSSEHGYSTPRRVTSCLQVLLTPYLADMSALPPNPPQYAFTTVDDDRLNPDEMEAINVYTQQKTPDREDTDFGLAQHS